MKTQKTTALLALIETCFFQPNVGKAAHFYIIKVSKPTKPFSLAQALGQKCVK
jgi:hypothetical protein